MPLSTYSSYFLSDKCAYLHIDLGYFVSNLIKGRVNRFKPSSVSATIIDSYINLGNVGEGLTLRSYCAFILTIFTLDLILVQLSAPRTAGRFIKYLIYKKQLPLYSICTAHQFECQQKTGNSNQAELVAWFRTQLYLYIFDRISYNSSDFVIYWNNLLMKFKVLYSSAYWKRILTGLTGGWSVL